MENLRSDCGMEHGWDARVAPGVSASVPETGDDEVLPDAPRFVEAPKDSLSSPPAPALFSVEPVPLTRYCPHVTKEACMEARGAQRCCEDVHFRRIKHPQTAREPNADCHFFAALSFFHHNLQVPALGNRRRSGRRRKSPDGAAAPVLRRRRGPRSRAPPRDSRAAVDLRGPEPSRPRPRDARRVWRGDDGPSGTSTSLYVTTLKSSTSG